MPFVNLVWMDFIKIKPDLIRFYFCVNSKNSIENHHSSWEWQFQSFFLFVVCSYYVQFCFVFSRIGQSNISVLFNWTSCPSHGHFPGQNILLSVCRVGAVELSWERSRQSYIHHECFTLKWNNGWRPFIINGDAAC